MRTAELIIIPICIIMFGLIALQYFEIKRIRKRIDLIESVKDTLCEVADRIAKTSSEQEVYKLILDTAVELIPNASRGSILLLEDDNQLHFKVIKGYSEELKKLTLKKEEAYLYNLNNFSETAIIRNPNKFDEDVVNPEKIDQLNSFEALDISCTLSSPIYIEEKLIGMINVDSTIKGKAFAEEDIKLMNYIKNELQLALKNSFIQNKLKYMANFDELTGLYNRRNFKQYFNKELFKIKRYKTKGCLALIDLDDFKFINDNYGHNMGDKALKIFADVLRETIKNIDIYARMSGDEFVIFFVNCTKDKAVKRLENIREALNSKKLGNIGLSFSYGICEIDPEEDMTPDDIFGHADKEMYNDKKSKNSRM